MDTNQTDSNAGSNACNSNHRGRRRHRRFDRHFCNSRFHGTGKLVVAVAFIIAGLTMLAHNLELISDSVYHIIISWQMVLIVIGILNLVKRQFIAGMIMLAVGIFMIIPKICYLGEGWTRSYWPILLIVMGIYILCWQIFYRNSIWQTKYGHRRGEVKEKVDDGFVSIGVSFGSTKTIVVDPVFKGAEIDVSFGSAILDLKRTILEAPETYVDIDCSFGSVELRVPSGWYVVVKSDNSFGGCEDKRWISQGVDYEHKLIVRGDISFAGIEIKD